MLARDNIGIGIPPSRLKDFLCFSLKNLHLHPLLSLSFNLIIIPSFLFFPTFVNLAIASQPTIIRSFTHML